MKWFTDEDKKDQLNKVFLKRANNPFPYIELVNFFCPTQLEMVLDDFNSIKSGWYHKVCKTSIKQSYPQITDLMEDRFYYNLLSPPWLLFLERITGIPNLIPDPYFFGGGFHNIPRGGFLKTHVDFNRHDKWGFDRRLNVLIFLNKDWKPEWGGDLILGENNEVRIPPLFNTTVIFETSDKSWHGHPEPLTCPEGESRKSIALYYYTNTNMYKKSHTTIYKE